MEETKLPNVTWNRHHRVYQGKYKVNGKWKTKVVPVNVQDEREAKVWFAQFLSSFTSTGVAPVNEEVVIDRRKTIRSLADRWLEVVRRDNDEKTYNACRRTLHTYLFPHSISHCDLENELDVGRCVAWIDWLRTLKGQKTRRPLAPLTIRNIVQGLRQFLVDVRGRGWANMRENPLLDPYIRRVMGRPEPVAGKGTIVCLTEEQARALLNAPLDRVPQWRRTLYAVGLYTGLRLSEIAGLSFGDLFLDDQDGTPRVRVFRQLRTGGEEPAFVSPKRGSHRWVPLHPRLVAELKAWKQSGWFEWTGSKPTDDSPVFPDLEGRYHCHPMARNTRDDLAALGQPTTAERRWPLTFHAARRTFLTLLTDAGAPAEVVASLAGHGGRTVTDRNYIAKNIGRYEPWVRKVLP